MSYAGPEFDSPRPPRRTRRPALTAAAVVVSAVMIATLAVQLTDDGTPSADGTPAGSGTEDARGRAPTANGPGSPATRPATDGTTREGATRSGAASAPAVPGATPDGTRPGTAGPGGGSPRDGEGPARLPLSGKVVVIDPGHNPGNFRHTEEIGRQVEMGTGRKACDATGTSTNAVAGGKAYTEAEFALDVSRVLRSRLRAQGATVVLTHDGDRPWGPCVDERARIGNEALADAVVSVHADGSARGNRGFHMILPALLEGPGANTAPIVGRSRDLGERIAGHFVRATGSAPSNYVGDGTALDVRDDLGGLNLSQVPKVFIECGNMRDPQDAALLTSDAWRERAARGISEGIMSFLRG
ncbi:N-acetylmuramoyl-L-alanine amidase [Streptomyces uncialis]|uniref:N-acetylmuramoyl-L-alanine amidase n=1 Tax=Streptomyces uncialis TaxID=1048205 RepID=UPI0033D93585